MPFAIRGMLRAGVLGVLAVDEGKARAALDVATADGMQARFSRDSISVGEGR